MKKILYILAGLFVIQFAGNPLYAAVGDLINIQLGNGRTYTNGAAINDVSGQYWNKFTYTEDDNADLFYSNNTLSTAKLTYAVDASVNLNISNIVMNSTDRNLFSGYLIIDQNSSEFILQGLDAGTYDLYVYSQVASNNSSSLQFTANGVSGSLTNNGTLTSLVEGANYLKTSVVVSDAGTLAISIAGNSQINGIQLLQTSTAPEPASMVLLGVGGVLAAAAKLRRKPGDVSDAVS